ncbi:arsenical-resistance protein [Dendrothele bispora CBS 962.96]|uniref:Arsenical-resistance protein n=1 Tax=Dendrothele bispora (strain CBS 962.96) TaxID=1314807 RepID=A0A4S8M8F6_DENBC|nr:arsenical-resistance protein [Dendrothele bispora CBS 962.96]
MDSKDEQPLHQTREITPEEATSSNLFRKLSVQDRLLTPAILLCMILGVVIGNFAPNVQGAFDTVRLKSVSVPIAIGLLVMMWPVLTKIQYETLPTMFRIRSSSSSHNATTNHSSKIYTHILLSLFLNWILGPFLMLGLAWLTLPDLPTYRTGVILVGLARCIAMVMIWNELAKGDREFCAVLVGINSVLQIGVYAPYAVVFVNLIGGEGDGNGGIRYLGIPLLLGISTRYTIWYFTSKSFLDNKFLPWFSPLALIGLLYTIIVMFAYQGKNIVHHLGPVFRVFVPMILYFIIMWTLAFSLVFWLHKREESKSRKLAIFDDEAQVQVRVEDADRANKREVQVTNDLTQTRGATALPDTSEQRQTLGKSEKSGRKYEYGYGYDMAVVQAFTAGSNNFELAIAVSISIYGVGSDQALAATIGPLVEVPVLLSLTWVALWLRDRFYNDSV